MKKLFAIALLSFSGMVTAQNNAPYLMYTCKVLEPCSQTSILGYCPTAFKMYRIGASRIVRFVGLRTVNGQRTSNLVLNERLSDGYKIGRYDKTFRMLSGWDDYEHHVMLYSNNGLKWGGYLTLEEDSQFRVICQSNNQN